MSAFANAIAFDMNAISSLAGLAIVTDSEGGLRAFNPYADPVSRPIFIDDKDQDVKEHPLHCSICCDVSYEPVITPCQHIFCFDCIATVLKTADCCPNDRRSLDRIDLRGIDSIHTYIYNRTMVQCPRCETWTGQMQHYRKHATTCTPASYVEELEDTVNGLTGQVALLQAILTTQNTALACDKEAQAKTAEESNQIRSELVRLKNENQALAGQIKSSGPSFDTRYGYDQNNMWDLTTTICRDLRNKPNDIDSTRIFNCLGRCYEASRRNGIAYDMKTKAHMLLATSLASNWFSHNQQCKLLEWCRNMKLSI